MSRNDLEADWEDLLDVGEVTLPYAADFYDEMANRLNAIGDHGSKGLLPSTTGPAGNALGEAIVRCHRFLYAVTEETADSHRAVGRSVAEAAYEYKQADEASARAIEMSAEDLTGSVASEFKQVDAGDYEYDGGYTFGNFVATDSGSGYEDALSGAPQQPVDHQDAGIANDRAQERLRLIDRGGDREPLPDGKD